ncbi:MAG: N-acetyltransferase [Proteobacteria bacterium]|nr:N-acetyltransferase [Pseudomonadota bacterium]
MTASFTIVTNCADHAAGIAAITLEAFVRKYGSGDKEVAIIDKLRSDGDVLVELVALDDGAIVGHAMFSRAAVAPSTIKVAALGPVCARTDRQKSGIGSALIREGLARCKALDFDAAVLLGDANYYKRFGFTRRAAHGFESKYAGPYFQALELRHGALHDGRWMFEYPKAFAAVE